MSSHPPKRLGAKIGTKLMGIWMVLTGLYLTQSNAGPLYIRLVHTNALKCALNQTASNWFEIIRIRSVHTTETESEFDYVTYCVLTR